MNLIWTVLIGLVAGTIARYLLPREVPGGIIVTTLLGMAGSVVATYLGHWVGWYRAGESAGFLGAVAGALIVLEAYSLITRLYE